MRLEGVASKVSELEARGFMTISWDRQTRREGGVAPGLGMDTRRMRTCSKVYQGSQRRE